MCVNFAKSTLAWFLKIQYLGVCCRLPTLVSSKMCVCVPVFHYSWTPLVEDRQRQRGWVRDGGGRGELAKEARKGRLEEVERDIVQPCAIQFQDVGLTLSPSVSL